MATLEKRISALEQVDQTDKFPRTVVISFQEPGEPKSEIQKLRDSVAGGAYQEWMREPGETEQAFKDQASKEATRKAGGVALLFRCD